MRKSILYAKPNLFVILLAIISIFMQAAGAGSDGDDRIVAMVTDQRNKAAQMLKQAEDRVRIAKADISAAQSAAMAARRNNNAEAVLIAREAEDVAKDELETAQELLKKATAFLKEREQALSGLKKALAAAESGARGVVIPESGKVRRFAAEGTPINDFSQPLLPGERINTGSRGQARLVVSKGDAEIVLQESTMMKILKDDLAGFEAELIDGICYINARIKRWSEKRLTVRTPSAVTSVRGTEFIVKISGSKTFIQVIKGSVVVTSAKRKEALIMETGESAMITPEGASKTVYSQDGTDGPKGKAYVPSH